MRPSKPSLSRARQGPFSHCVVKPLLTFWARTPPFWASRRSLPPPQMVHFGSSGERERCPSPGLSFSGVSRHHPRPNRPSQRALSPSDPPTTRTPLAHTTHTRYTVTPTHTTPHPSLAGPLLTHLLSLSPFHPPHYTQTHTPPPPQLLVSVPIPYPGHPPIST